MTTGSLLIIVSLLMIVGLFLARPFLLHKQPERILTEHQFLEAEKEALLARIRAIDFDLETGKQHVEDHEVEREILMARATEVLKALDETQDIDQLIEATVKRIVETEKQKEDQVSEIAAKTGTVTETEKEKEA